MAFLAIERGLLFLIPSMQRRAIGKYDGFSGPTIDYEDHFGGFDDGRAPDDRDRSDAGGCPKSYTL